MARGLFILSIGDDNVILTHFANGSLKNAWMGDPDPELAHEEFGEAFATDKRADLMVLLDTLDQTYQQDELPKVGLMDRRKILNRHMMVEFSGQNIRGAKLVKENPDKTLTYQFVSIPVEGRVLEWVTFVGSLPNELIGLSAIATEGSSLAAHLVPEDLDPIEEGNHWRHIIGVNVTGGFRQIVEKNGSLGFTRLTQAPPEGTDPAEFADNINRDFKATVTYIKRLGYVAGDTLDLIILTSQEIKEKLAGLEWGDARSVTVLTPHEAAQRVEIESIGSEDQSFCDVLYAAWLAKKGTPELKLTRAAIGDPKEDLRDLSFLAAPYAAGLAMFGLFAFLMWNVFQEDAASKENGDLQLAVSRAQSEQSRALQDVSGLPYDAERMRTIFQIVDSLEGGRVSISADLLTIFEALDGEAVILEYLFGADEPSRSAPLEPLYSIDVRMKLDELIRTADEALEVSRNIEQRLIDGFGEGYQVEMTLEPVGAQAEEEFAGGLFGTDTSTGAVEAEESFYAEYRIAKGER